MASISYEAIHVTAIHHLQAVAVDDFMAAGINDLAKYRIVQFLAARPESCCDASAFTESLGLRPVERAVAELEELVERNILERLEIGDVVRYRLTREKEKRVQLVRLFVMARPGCCHSSILSRLAAKSLDRVRAANRRKKK